MVVDIRNWKPFSQDDNSHDSDDEEDDQLKDRGREGGLSGLKARVINLNKSLSPCMGYRKNAIKINCCY